MKARAATSGTNLMTDPTNQAEWSGFAAPSKPNWEARAHTTLEALAVALEATRLAIEVASDAPTRASYQQLTVSQIVESWHGANLLVHTMFEALHAQARYSIDLIKPMPAQD
jgi:hypothetical protein